MKKYLIDTTLMDYKNPIIQNLIKYKQWLLFNDKEKVFNIYNFVRDIIIFGYNKNDNLKASEVLQDGYGQCNTKGTLFMALLRAVGIPCRLHGFYIDKKLQKGALKSFYYKLSPQEILHSWVEIYYKDEWLNLEGFILDLPYLNKLQLKFSDCIGSFCGYGVATNDFKNPSIEWNESDTYIQKEGIVKDLGVFDTPDEFYLKHNQKLGAFKQFMFSRIIRHLMNKNIEKIRG